MDLFSTNPLSALRSDISARETIGIKKKFPEIGELQYNTDYGKGYDIFRNRVIYFFISSR
jgi:hypothetical protein